jgi:hypothetical protein
MRRSHRSFSLNSIAYLASGGTTYLHVSCVMFKRNQRVGTIAGS